MAITRHLDAIQDLIDISDYLAQFSAATAYRFLKKAETTFRLLNRFPKLGLPCLFRDPALLGIRRRRIDGSKHYMAYYRIVSSGIEIIRVLDGRRDVRQVFGKSSDPE